MNAPETRRLRTKEVAVLVRAELKIKFPGIKFSVVSREYAGGSSIDVVYVDGPRAQDVDAAIDPFCGSDFNKKNDDSTDYRPATKLKTGEMVTFGVNFINARRTLSDDAKARVEAVFVRLSGGKASNDPAFRGDGPMLLHRLARCLDFSERQFLFDGVIIDEDDAIAFLSTFCPALTVLGAEFRDATKSARGTGSARS